MGGKSTSGSKTYTGSFALLLGFGPADSLVSIDDGQNIVWPTTRTTLVSSQRVDTSGAIFRDSAKDADGKTVLQTSIGTMRFYWGTDGQIIDPLLASLKLDQGLGIVANVPMPSLNKMIYVVCDNVKLGSSPSAPKLYFTVSRFSSGLNLTRGISRIAVGDPGIGYVQSPTVQIVGDGTGAAAVAILKNTGVVEVTVTEQGTGYTSATVSFVGGLNTGPQVAATATAVLSGHSLSKISMTDGGENYAEAPAVVITGDGSGAVATAKVNSGKVIGVEINDAGRGYTTAAISFVGGFARAGSAAALLFHELNGDSILPEVVFDMFVDQLYGLGLATSNMIVQDFVDAANQIRAEDLGVSPYFDRSQTLREMIGTLNPYIDSFIYLSGGKIGFKLIRPVDLLTAFPLDENDFTEELQPDYQGIDQTWSMTRLSFTDQTNQWKSDSEPYDNRVVSDVLGYSIEQEASYPFIIRREVAKRIVKRVGIKAGHAPVFYRAKLLPKHSARRIGDVVLLSYAKLGLVNIPARIMERTIGPATQPEVDCLFMLEQARSDAHDYTPPPDFLVTPALVTNDLGKVVQWSFIPTQPRLMVLPPDLLGNKKDGFLTAFNRKLTTDLKGQIWFTPDPSQTPYKKQMKSDDIPALGQVRSWHKCADSEKSWIVRVQFSNELDYDYFVDLIANSDDIYFVFGRHDVRLAGSPSDQQQVEGFWAAVVNGGYFKQISADMFDVQILTGQFAWPEFALETLAAASNGPGEICYVGNLNAFAIYPTNAIRFQRSGGNGPGDVDLKRRVKVALINHKKTEVLEDTIEANYDLNDTTMSPEGTYSPDWGLKTKTMYELFDRLAGDFFVSQSAISFNLVRDIDEAMLRFYDGVATADDKIVFSSIDQVLGAYFQRADGIYNTKA